jgi:hypothetical protein
MSASSVTLSKRLLGTWGRRHVPTWVGESGLVTLLVLLPELWLRVRGDSILTLDALSSNIPLKQLAIDQLMDGRVPLWSSKLANGFPLLADSVSLPFDPRNLFFWIADRTDAYWLSVVSAQVVGTLLLYWYLRRRHGLGILAGVVGGFVFTHSTVLFAESRLHSTAMAILLFPGAVWLTDRLGDRTDWRRAMQLGLFWALLFVSGGPAYGVYLPVLAGIWGLATIGFRRGAARLRRAARFLVGYVAAGVWGVLVAAIALLPFLEFVANSSRGGEYRDDPFVYRSIWFGMFGAQPPSALVPDFSYFFYVGVIVLPLVIVAWRRRDNRYLRALPWLAGGTLVVCAVLMTPLKARLIDVIPQIAVIPAFRPAFFWGFCAAVLAAYAVDRLDWELTGARRVAAWAVFVLQAGGVLGAAVALGFLFTLRREALADYVPLYDVIAYLRPVLTFGFVALIVVRALGTGLALVSPRLRWSMPGVGWSFSPRLVVAALVVVELAVAWDTIRPIQPHAGKLYPFTAPVAYLQHRAGPNDRVMQIASNPAWGPIPPVPPEEAVTLGLDALAYHGLWTPTVYESLVVGRYGDTFFDFASQPKTGRAPVALLEMSEPASPLIDAFGVRYLISNQTLPPNPHYREVFSSPGYKVYTVSDPLPRAYFVGMARRMPASAVHAELRRLSVGMRGAADLHRQVLLTGSGPTPATGGRATFAPARVTRDDDEDVEVLLNAPSAGWLVLTDTMFPGWSVTVDGRPARIEVANGYARAVAVGSGRHVVRFGYAPSSFRWGAAVSGAALAVSGVVLLLVPAIRRRRRGSTTRGG